MEVPRSVPCHFLTAHLLFVTTKSEKEREEVKESVFYTSYSHMQKREDYEALLCESKGMKEEKIYQRRGF